MARKKEASNNVIDFTEHIPITIVSMDSFTKNALKLMGQDSLNAIIDHIAQLRQLGRIISGSGGLRKMRCAIAGNKGKSSGARIIYYYGGEHMPIYLIAIYPKGKNVSMSGAEKRAAKKLVEFIKRQHAVPLRRSKLRVVSKAH